MGELVKEYQKKAESHEIDLRFDVGNILINEFDKQKIDNKEFAKRLGKSVIYIDNVRNGDKKMNLAEVGNIAHALGIRFEIKIKKKQ